MCSSDLQVYVVKTKDFENFKRTGVRQGNANIRVLDAERRMQDIASQTGGWVYSPLDENELNVAFNNITVELADQYILSYYPEGENDHGGEFRNITVMSRSDFNACSSVCAEQLTVRPNAIKTKTERKAEVNRWL